MEQSEQSNASYGSLAAYGLIAILWAACVISAIGVVYSAFTSRQNMQALEQLRRDAEAMQVMAGQYMLEKSSWAAYSRVEKIARNELKMKPPETSQTVLVYRR